METEKFGALGSILSRYTRIMIIPSKRIINKPGFVWIAVIVFIMIFSGPIEHDTTNLSWTEDKSDYESRSSDNDDQRGNLDYNLINTEDIWMSNSESVSTDLFHHDLNGDDQDDLIFGTTGGKLYCINLIDKIIILNLSVSTGKVIDIVIGNVDDDPTLELIIATSTGLRCYDLSTKKFSWTIQETMWYGQLSLLNVDSSLTRSNIFLLVTNVYDHSIYKIDGEGKEIFNKSIEPFNSMTGGNPEIGGRLSFLLVDFYNDGVMDIFLSDVGRSLISPGGLDLIGRHIWVLSTEDGELVFSGSYPQTVFSSSPIEFTYLNEKYIAIGLTVRWIPSEFLDLLLIEIDSGEIHFYDLYDNNDTVRWKYLSQVSNDSLILYGQSGEIILWSYSNEETIWNNDIGGQAKTNVVICDIDSDMTKEIIVPNYNIRVFSITDCSIESDLIDKKEPDQHQRISVFDVDNDSFVEICFGYQNVFTGKYKVMIIDSPNLMVKIDEEIIPPQSIIYSGIDNMIGFRIENASENRAPVYLNASLESAHSDYVFNAALDLINNNISQNHMNLILVTSFDNNLVDGDYHVNLSLMPTWELDFEGFFGISLQITFSNGFILHSYFEDVFRVERDLVFYGDVELHSDIQGVLSNGSWVRTGENLTIQGFHVGYEGTMSKKPPSGAYRIDIYVENQSYEFPPPYGEGQKYRFPGASIEGRFELKIKIHIIPIEEYSNSMVLRNLRADGTEPFIIEYYPMESEWLSSSVVTIAIHAGDNGSGINTDSIRYTVLFNSSRNQDNPWMSVAKSDIYKTPYGYSIEVSNTIEEGHNRVVWNLSDIVGNRLLYEQTIKVDLSKIEFSSFKPSDWVASVDVTCSVNVTDLGGSGVNGSSLSYSYSTTNIYSFSEWHPIPEHSNGHIIPINVLYKGINGTHNYIRFRGKDIAGNELLSSEVYRISIDIKPPSIDIRFPENGSTISPLGRKISLTIVEYDSGLNDVIPLLLDTESNEQIEIKVEVVNVSANLYIYNFTWENVNEISLRFTITCSDRIGNIRVASIGEFYINKPPIITLISPKDGKEYYRGNDIIFEVNIEDPDSDPVSINWVIDGNISLSMEAFFVNRSIPEGTHVIVVIVADQYYFSTEEIEITVIIPEQESLDDGLLIIVLLLSIIVFSSVVLIIRRRKE